MNTRTRRRLEPAERRIYFFRVDAGAGPSGIPNKYPLSAALQEVDQIPFEEDPGRYAEQVDGNPLCAWIDEGHEKNLHFRLATIRRTALPQSEFRGKLRALNLDDEEGLYEATHFVAFPTGIVGVEYNYYGPRASRLPYYIRRVTKGAFADFKLEALLNQDAAKQLEGKDGIRLFRLSIRPAFSNTVAQVNRSVGRALDALADGSNARVVGVELRPEPHKRNLLSAEMFHSTQRLARIEGLQENAFEFSVKAVSDEGRTVTEIDLLQDHLARKVKIMRTSSRSGALDDNDAYRKIEESYVELENDLLKAASASIRNHR